MSNDVRVVSLFSGCKHAVLQAFSASANVLKLLKFSLSEDRLDCIHGMKFVSICLIIMGHRLMFVLGSPIVNTEFVEGVSTLGKINIDYR